MAEKKHRILGVIPVSEKTWWKWVKIKHKASDVGIPMFVGATMGAAWCSYTNMFRNVKEHRQIAGHINQLADAHNDNVTALNKQGERISELERQNALLMERALRETEGKT